MGKVLINHLSAFIWLLIWMGGVVLAKGFWSTTAAIFTGGLWSFYLVLEKIMLFYGIV